MVNDGGRAFPVIPPPDGAGYPFPDGGMSLRDYFAGQAMVGLLAGKAMPEGVSWALTVANWSYEQADAMLKARETKNGD